ncbi:hypothetical protein TNCV_4902881 [Trichonephila clavipes]|nr:hypothetical protein TNCV_4902881 [Trichonephila clavipes]
MSYGFEFITTGLKLYTLNRPDIQCLQDAKSANLLNEEPTQVDFHPMTAVLSYYTQHAPISFTPVRDK